MLSSHALPHRSIRFAIPALARPSRRVTTLIAALVCALTLAACGSAKGTSGKRSTNGGTPAVTGRTLFIATCGVCHTMADASTNGAVGPNLDDLQPSRETVQAQIDNGGGGMPAGLLHGQDAKAVAAYVATSAGK